MLTNTGGVQIAVGEGVTITGGVGGRTGGQAGLFVGGGVGIRGASLTLTLAAGSSVSGATSNNYNYDSAIEFAGTTNVLELLGNGGITGDTYAVIHGNVNGSATAGASNTVKLGSGGGIFSLAQLDAGNGNGAQFQNFDKVTIADGTWTLLGSQGGTRGVTWSIDGGTGLLTGNLLGSVTVKSGGTLALQSGGGAAVSGGGSLTLDPGSTLRVTLGAPSATALVSVAGSVTNGGALVIAGRSGFGEGIYVFTQYGSTLTGLSFTSISGPEDFSYSVSHDPTGKELQLNVIDLASYWNGSQTAGSANSISGGSGTWTAAAGGDTNWTNHGGTSHVVADPARPAVFAGRAAPRMAMGVAAEILARPRDSGSFPGRVALGRKVSRAG